MFWIVFFSTCLKFIKFCLLFPLSGIMKILLKLIGSFLLLLTVDIVTGNHCYYAITDIENKVTKADANLETRTNLIGERISHIEEVLEKLELHSPMGKQITTGNLFVIERTRTIKGRYMGCFKDLEENRLFRGLINKYRYNTVDKCIDSCIESGFVYAGLSL